MQKRFVLMVSLGVLASAASARAQSYTQHNLVSDGVAVPADRFDPNLVNAWGLVASSSSPWWSANNGSATSTLYDGAGVPRPLVVGIPGAPTGIVFNGTMGFVVRSGTAAAPARFIFATEDGAIAGWAPGVRLTLAIVAADRSSSGAVYKGLASGSTPSGASFLYATDFHNGVVDIFDSAFARVGSFTDHRLPRGYAPFGIQNVGGTLYVTFAKQDAARHDDVAGAGHGFVDAFDLAGHLVRRVASRGRLNSPWGITVAPATFGAFAGDLLIGNFGDGKINAFDPPSTSGDDELRRKGQLRSAACQPLSIDGLWALQFGNGAGSGSKDTLYFTAGPDGEKHGLLGMIVPAPAPDRCDDDEGENED